ncbi:SDR family oxidoreductase [Pelagibius sp. Alg239-R121]|uniref:SDR family oxidoreductase n=1 Tax=Pelagibius sp. Alg239-R121 TaxID=2993448 RepID=UPI0024A79542|nr:SDR family oxidoreductase [Pelagibius sp. Alg239-R121]
MPTLLITGANRGIGLALVQSFAKDGWKIHACCRNLEKSKDLKAVSGDITRHKLDVTDNLKVEALARQLADEPIDLLLNNAGVYNTREGYGATDYDAWSEMLAVNTLSPLRVVEHFADLVAKSDRKLIANMSSRLGSISAAEKGGNYPYRTSKCALNMVTKLLSIDLAERGITTIAMHPGWVQTDMGGGTADITVDESVRGLRALLDCTGPDDNGGFFNYDGSALPW